MPLRPFDITREESELPDELNSILVDAGLPPSAVTPTLKDSRLESAREVFNAAGASLTNAAATIANIMNKDDNGNTRLRASEMALKVHGILNEIDEKHIPTITININGSESKTLVNLVLPTP